MLLLLSVATFVSFVSSESCFFQRCLGCHPQETVYPGSPVDCHPSRWVSAEWIHNLGHPPPATDSRIPVEMRCLKMVATPDDKSFGNTVDTIKGCVPRVQVESVCVGLVAVERARGHSDARCFICNGDNCNGTDRLTVSYVLLVAVLYFVFR
ncbi:uncharacterized protein LOC121735296 [Aricia agestis]|uniref:uncharacterized protein LOC121735296 n=1 Tax=Aricia agestis TaxID=91739 RepID=UPI001C207712|nr:uncharacterized protein LOC121735296 [Aricia agestis]